MLKYIISIMSVLFFLMVTQPGPALGNEALLTGVYVSARVTFDSNSKIYQYEYSLSNGKESKGRIDSFIVTIRYPDGGERLSDAYLFKKGPDPVAALPDEIRTAMEKFQEMLPPIVPVSLTSPSAWVSITLGNARWGSDEGTIGAGETLSGFVIESPGLPAIREFHADPKVDNPPAGRELIFQGKTIGPTAPPAAIVYDEFFRYLTSMEREAYKLGWIKEDVLFDAIEVGLKKARDAAELFKEEEAHKAISSLLDKVEAGKESSLSSEGYALLKYNLQYLLKKL
jgi:hypothetical protein